MEAVGNTLDPLVSIITVSSFDAVGFSKTFASVIEQSYGNWELIAVINPKSEETIRAATKAREDSIQVKVFHDKGKGIYPAMNLGLTKATGKFVIFMNSSDRFYDSESLKVLVKSIQNSKWDLVVGNHLIEGYSKPRSNFKNKRITAKAFAFNRRWGCHQSMIFRFSRDLEFPTEYELAADFDLVLKILMQGEALRIGRCVSVIKPGGRSDVNLARVFKEKHLIRMKYLRGSINYFFSLIWSATAIMKLRLRRIMK